MVKMAFSENTNGRMKMCADFDKEINCKQYVCEHEKEVIEFFRNEYSDERMTEDNVFVENYVSLFDDYSEGYEKW